MIYHTDHLWTIMFLTGEGGKKSAEHSPFGEVLIAKGGRAKHNFYTFTGREYLERLGMFDYRARIYDPRPGRFVEVDPANQKFKLYTYTLNNPVNNTDPSGNVACPKGTKCSTENGRIKVEVFHSTKYVASLFIDRFVFARLDISYSCCGCVVLGFLKCKEGRVNCDFGISLSIYYIKSLKASFQIYEEYGKYYEKSPNLPTVVFLTESIRPWFGKENRLTTYSCFLNARISSSGIECWTFNERKTKENIRRTVAAVGKKEIEKKLESQIRADSDAGKIPGLTAMAFGTAINEIQIGF